MSGQVLLDLVGGLDARHARHRHVQHDDVGLVLDGRLDGLHPVLRLRDDADALLLVEQHAHAGANDPVVVGDERVDHQAGTCSLRVVPRPGRGVHLELAVHEARALGHAVQPEAAELVAHHEALAVVGDLERHAAVGAGDAGPRRCSRAHGGRCC